MLEIDLVEVDDLLVLVKTMKEELSCRFHAEKMDVLTE